MAAMHILLLSPLASEIFLAPESVGLGRISCVSSQLYVSAENALCD